LGLCWEAVELLFDSTVSTSGVGVAPTPESFDQFRSFDDWFEACLLDTILAGVAARGVAAGHIRVDGGTDPHGDR
jgi:hypothetical protein